MKYELDPDKSPKMRVLIKQGDEEEIHEMAMGDAFKSDRPFTFMIIGVEAGGGAWVHQPDPPPDLGIHVSDGLRPAGHFGGAPKPR